MTHVAWAHFGFPPKVRPEYIVMLQTALSGGGPRTNITGPISNTEQRMNVFSRFHKHVTIKYAAPRNLPLETIMKIKHVIDKKNASNYFGTRK
jgi:hypothetical protein